MISKICWSPRDAETEAKRKSVLMGDGSYPVQQKGCAERIAPIGTLSQNGYGESLVAYTGTYLMTNYVAP